ncbi:MAG: hypothetical protein QXP91_09725 [Candidatus Methanomethylicia archaeon]
MTRHLYSVISFFASLVIALGTVLQMDLPFGFEDYVKQLIVGNHSYNVIVFLSHFLSRCYGLILSIKISIFLAYIFIPIPMYILTYNLFKSRIVAIISSLSTSMITVFSLNPIYVEGIPVALFLPFLSLSLHKLHSKKSWLNIFSLTVIVLLIILVDFKTCYMVSAMLILFLIYSRELVKILPSLILSFSLMLYHLIAIGFQPSQISISLPTPLLIMVAISSSAGLYITFEKYRDTLPFIIIPIASTALLLPVASYSLIILVVSALPLASSPLILYKDIFKISRIVEGDRDIYDLEINLNRVIALALVLALLTVSIQSMSVFAGSYQTSLGRAQAIRDVSSTIAKIASSSGYIAAPPILSIWIEALTGLRMLANHGYDYENDALLSTTYRLMNGYIIADDTNPLSSMYAPRIRVYDGEWYLNTILINEYNVTISVLNTTLNLDNRYVADIHLDGLALTVLYRLPMVTIRKTEVLSRENPTLNITYTLSAVGGDVNIEVPIYAYHALFVVNDGKIIAINRDYVQIFISSSGVLNITTLKNVATVRSSSKGPLRLEMMFTFPNAKKSSIQPNSYSFTDLAKKLNVSYIVTDRVRDQLLSLFQRSKTAVLKLDENMISILTDKYYSSISTGNITRTNTTAIYDTYSFTVFRKNADNNIVYNVVSKNDSLQLLIVKYEVSMNRLSSWLINGSRATFKYMDSNITVTFSKGIHDFEYYLNKIVCSVLIPINHAGDEVTINISGGDIDFTDSLIEIHLWSGVLSRVVEVRGYILYRVV